MKAQLYYNTHEKPLYAPGGMNATASVISSGQRNKTMNEREYIFIGKHLFNIFIPSVYSVQQKAILSLRTRQKTLMVNTKFIG